VDIYYKRGSYVGFISDKGAWTKIASADIVVTNIQQPTKVLLPRTQSLGSQETGAFYIISTDIYISYSTGSALGQELTHDAVLTLRQGHGTAKPAFGANTASYAPRAFNGTIYYTTNSVPLPVTLVSFSGEAKGATNHLQWQTASEVNSAYFIVEHSADGQAFASLGTVAASYFSQQSHSYTYVDAALPGRWYYRLQQVDRDGTTHYSAVVVLTSSQFTLAAYPNPVYNELQVVPATSTAYPLTLQLYTANGQLAYQGLCSAPGPQLLRIQVAEFTAGLYLLKVIAADGQVSCCTILKAS
jgi:hypothetical protein